jgi:hypothetical protein
MTKETGAKWVERIRDWRASSLSATEFAKDKGYKASTLSWALVLVRTHPVCETAVAEMVVEIGAVRVRVLRGFDASLPP